MTSNATKQAPKTDAHRTNTGLFQTVVFSRKSTNHGPIGDRNSSHSPPKAATMRKPLADLHANPLASIVHQTDRNGKQQSVNGLFPNTSGGNGSPSKTASLRVFTKQETDSINGGPHGISKLFANIWSALGISEQQLTAQKNALKGPSATKAAVASQKSIETRRTIIGPQAPQDKGKKCLVLDLDETLVHSSFKPVLSPDYVIPVEIEGVVHQVYVCKRPGTDIFLKEMAKYFEIVVYTASLSKYADPLLDRLDPERLIRFRLFREHCVQYEGNFVKDLSLLDREITQTIIVDNSPMSYLFHPRNAIGCSSFIDDVNDRELDSIARFLVSIRDVADIRSHVSSWTASY